MGDNNVTVERNLSSSLPNGAISGVWTTPPRGASDPQPLPLGYSCRFFGCYVLRTYDASTTTYFVTTVEPRSCVIDRDECSDGSADCEHECTDIMSGTANSYQCSCRKGYTLSHDQHNCTDVDECVTGVHTCEQTCTATSDGWYDCSCIDGFTLHTDEHTCEDIDECVSNDTVLCDTEVTGRECINTMGSYHCRCVLGFQFDQHLMMCTDIDECAINSTVLCQHHCINTNGSYNCSCGKWYEQIDFNNCTALDVCTLLSVECGAHSECVSSPDDEEGYRCVCDSGYEQTGGSCSLRGIVHMYWVLSLVVFLSILLLLGSSYLLGRKYLQNKRDIQKQYSVLFRYQVKREEIDPYYNPVGINPPRKVSYTFSLMSTLEAYEYPIMHESDTVPDVDASSDHLQLYPSNGQLTLTADPDDHSKRELSAITEHSEDGVLVGKTTEVPNEPMKISNPLFSQDDVDIPIPHPSDLEVGRTVSSAAGYVEETDMGSPTPAITRDCHSQSSSVGHSEATCALETYDAEAALKKPTLEAQPGPYVDMEGVPPIASNAEKEQGLPIEPQVNSGISVSLPFHQHPPIAQTDHHTTAQSCTADSDAYIPSGSNITSSGYGTETGFVNSYKSRLMSISSYVTDTSMASSGGYVPSHISSGSSGYASDSGISGNRHGSVLSCDSPGMPHFGNGWANGDYVTDTDLYKSSVAGKNLEEPEHHITELPEPTDTTRVPVNPSTVTDHSEGWSMVATGGYIPYPDHNQAALKDSTTLTTT